MEKFKCKECNAVLDYVLIEYVARQKVKVADYCKGNYEPSTEKFEDGHTMCPGCYAEVVIIKG